VSFYLSVTEQRVVGGIVATLEGKDIPVTGTAQDTVTGAFQRFERLNDATARGPGVIDMKGGDVVMLLALRALSDAGALDWLSFRVVLSGDEEKAGLPHALSRRDLQEAADWADLAIGNDGQ
jgi:glutamate carboxypeptidase